MSHDDRGVLEVFVVQGLNLSGRDMYCKLQLGESIKKSYVKSKKNPVWNQKFIFDRTRASADKLRVSVMESNTFVADEWLGGVEINLDNLQHGIPVQAAFDVSRDSQSRQIIVNLVWHAYSPPEEKNKEPVSIHTGSSASSASSASSSSASSSSSSSDSSQLVHRMAGRVSESELISAKRRQLLGRSPYVLASIEAFTHNLAGPSDPNHGSLARKHKLVMAEFAEKDAVLDKAEKGLSQLEYMLKETDALLNRSLIILKRIPQPD